MRIAFVEWLIAWLADKRVQLLVGWKAKTRIWMELECANGFSCDKIEMNVQVLHCVQVG